MQLLTSLYFLCLKNVYLYSDLCTASFSYISKFKNINNSIRFLLRLTSERVQTRQVYFVAKNYLVKGRIVKILSKGKFSHKRTHHEKLLYTLFTTPQAKQFNASGNYKQNRIFIQVHRPHKSSLYPLTNSKHISLGPFAWCWDTRRF